MREPLPMMLVPGLLCSARLYAEQIAALWRFGPVTVADHRRDDTMEAIARAHPRDRAAALRARRALDGRLHRLVDPAAGAGAGRAAGAARYLGAPDTPEQTERRRAQIALARGGRFAEIADLLWPLFVHRDRHGDAALHGIVRTMADETGAEAFVRQQHAIMTRPDARPMLGRSNVRRWCWSATATS